MKKTMNIFLIVDALIWLIFAVFIMSGRHRGLPDDGQVKLIMTFLALGTAAAIPLLLFLYRRLNQVWASYLLLIGLAVILFLTVTDEFGWPDLAVLVLHGIPFGLLLFERLRKDPSVVPPLPS